MTEIEDFVQENVYNWNLNMRNRKLLEQQHIESMKLDAVSDELRPDLKKDETEDGTE